MSAPKKPVQGGGSPPSQQILRRVIMTLGTGGVGKTFFVRLLIDWLLVKIVEWAVTFRVIDTDEKAKNDLARFFDVVQHHELTTRADISALLNSIRAGDGLSVIDVKADRQSEFIQTRIFTPNVMSALREEGMQTIACIPITAGKFGSMASALDWYHILGPSCDYVLIENEVAGPIDWNKVPKQLNEFREWAKPLTFRIPRLEEEVARELDNTNHTVLGLLQAAGYEVQGIKVKEAAPTLQDDFGLVLSAFWNMEEAQKLWVEFQKQAEDTFPKLLGYAP